MSIFYRNLSRRRSVFTEILVTGGHFLPRFPLAITFVQNFASAVNFQQFFLSVGIYRKSYACRCQILAKFLPHVVNCSKFFKLFEKPIFDALIVFLAQPLKVTRQTSFSKLTSRLMQHPYSWSVSTLLGARSAQRMLVFVLKRACT